MAKQKELELDSVAIVQRNFRDCQRRQKRAKTKRIKIALLAGAIVIATIPTAVFANGGKVAAEMAERELIPGNYYPATFVVTEIDHAADLVTIRNANGFEYAFRGVENWWPGDICATIMDDMNTADITDDEVVYPPLYSGMADRYIIEWTETNKT